MFRTLLFILLIAVPLYAVNYHETHPDAWNKNNINDTALALYGKEKFSTIKQTPNIELITPKTIVENPEQIPIEVYSNIPAKSIAVMVDNHDKALIAVFHQDHFDKTEIKVNIRLERKATLFVVIESLSGVLYYKRAFIDVLCLPCMAN